MSLIKPMDLQLPPLHGIQFDLQSTVERLGEESALNIPVSYLKRPETLNSVPIWSLVDKGERYQSTIQLYRDDGYVLDIDCEGSGQFKVSSDGLAIYWRDTGTDFRHYLQTFGASLLLETNGVPCIHANALVKDDKAILLMAPSRTGKSSMSAALMNHGWNLYTDDMVACYSKDKNSYGVYPSWSKLRLWPDSWNTLVPSDNNTETRNVHARFAKKEVEFTGNEIKHRRVPIVAAYMLERIEDSSNIVLDVNKLSSSLAVMLMAQNSMLADAYRSMGIEQSRLTQLAAIAEKIPFYRASYRSGFDIIDVVSQQISSHGVAHF